MNGAQVGQCVYVRNLAILFPPQYKYYGRSLTATVNRAFTIINAANMVCSAAILKMLVSYNVIFRFIRF